MAAVAASRVGLLLPQLDAAVPSKVHSTAATVANARLASFLLDAGVVREADVPRAWHDPLTICETALQRWLELVSGITEAERDIARSYACDGEKVVVSRTY